MARLAQGLLKANACQFTLELSERFAPWPSVVSLASRFSASPSQTHRFLLQTAAWIRVWLQVAQIQDIVERHIKLAALALEQKAIHVAAIWQMVAAARKVPDAETADLLISSAVLAIRPK